MSIEIIKEDLKIEESKGSSDVQVLVETEIYLNTIEASIEKVIWAEGDVEVTNTMIINDKILVNGLVNYNIVYQTKDEENEEIHSIDAIKDFNEEIRINGITEDMINEVEANIEHMEYELGESSIGISALVNISGEVSEIRTLEVIQDVEGQEDLETLKETIKYEEVYGRGESYADINETVEIGEGKPSIERILNFSVDAKEIESTVVDDRIVVSGEARVSIIYLGDEELYSLEKEIPFNHFVDIPGVYADAKCQVKLDIAESTYNIMEDETGEQGLIDIDIKVKVSGKVYDENSKDLIIDAYSTREEITLEKEDMILPEKYDHIIHEDSLKLEVEINAIDLLDIKQDNNIIDKRMTDEGIIVEGALDISIYYIPRIEDNLAIYKDHYPYSITIPYEKEGEDLIIEERCKIKDLDYTLKRDNVSVELDMVHNIALKKQRQIQGINNIEYEGQLIDKKSKPSIRIYIAQKGDILWDIARRYNTTIDEILSSNNLDSNYKIQAGDKIIIEKKLDLDF